MTSEGREAAATAVAVETLAGNDDNSVDVSNSTLAVGVKGKRACVMSLSVKLKTRETQSTQSVRQALFGDRVDVVTVQPRFLPVSLCELPKGR